MSKDSSCAAEVLISFMVGALVGAGTALLLAPYSGEETRGKIRTAASTATSKSAEIYDDARDMMTHFKEEIGTLIDEKLEQVGIKAKHVDQG